MTVTPLWPAYAPAARVPVHQPAQAGRPWTDEAQAQLVERVRAGDDLEALAAGCERSTTAVANRLRRMLPVDERGCPVDRVLLRLRELVADEAYDWRDALLRTPPPAPIVRNEIQGLPGLSRHHLLAFAYAAFNSPLADPGLLGELREECTRRGLDYEVRCTLEDALRAGRLNASEESVVAMAAAWWNGTLRPFGSDRGRYSAEPPW